MSNIRYTNDDLIPKLRDAGITAVLEEWMAKNCPEEVLLWIASNFSGFDLITLQLRQLIADLKGIGDLEAADISGDSLPEAIVRTAAPSGIGCAGGNVWITPPETPFVLRFYVNGTLKLTQADYYITSLEAIGALSGDVVQICQVVAGIVGWWTRITVP